MVKDETAEMKQRNYVLNQALSCAFVPFNIQIRRIRKLIIAVKVRLGSAVRLLAFDLLLLCVFFLLKREELASVWEEFKADSTASDKLCSLDADTDCLVELTSGVVFSCSAAGAGVSSLVSTTTQFSS